jgi:hypothetical protein
MNAFIPLLLKGVSTIGQSYSKTLPINDRVFKYKLEQPAVDKEVMLGKKVVYREERCRSILTHIFKKPFPTKRPRFLRNPNTGRNLELDCYSEPLKLGVEIQSLLHQKYIPYYHKTFANYLKYKERDALKKQMCIRSGVTLICIPPPEELPNCELEKYIMMRLQKDYFSKMR